MLTVRFSRNGFYHPALGRVGMGDNAGKVYQLPDEFAEKGMLPKSAEILNEVSPEDLEDIMGEAGQDKVDKPRIDKDELERAVKKARGQSVTASRKRKGVKTVAEMQAEKASGPEAEAESEVEVEVEVETETEGGGEGETFTVTKRRSRRAG